MLTLGWLWFNLFLLRAWVHAGLGSCEQRRKRHCAGGHQTPKRRCGGGDAGLRECADVGADVGRYKVMGDPQAPPGAFPGVARPPKLAK